MNGQRVGTFGSTVLSVLGAHAMMFAIVGVLPDPAFSALGIHSVQRATRGAFEAAHSTRGYDQVLRDLSRGDLGRTLDGVSVSGEVSLALLATAPRFLCALALVAVVVLIVASAPVRYLNVLGRLGLLFAFFPPFLAPFTLLGLFLAGQTLFGPLPLALPWWLSVLALALPAASLAGAQTALITSRNLASRFALATRAIGLGRLRLRVRLLRNLSMEIAPTIEKLATGLITGALFAEVIFSQSGVGTLTLRAIRRTDVDLLLALVLIFATTVGIGRAIAAWLRGGAGLYST